MSFVDGLKKVIKSFKDCWLTKRIRRSLDTMKCIRGRRESSAEPREITSLGAKKLFRTETRDRGEDGGSERPGL